MQIFEENNFFTRNIENFVAGGIIINYTKHKYGIELEFAHKEMANDFLVNIELITGIRGVIDNNKVNYYSGGLFIIHGIGKGLEEQFRYTYNI